MNRTPSAAQVSKSLRSDTRVEIVGEAFPERKLLQFVDDCIVPALVEQFLRSRVNLSGSIGSEHNVDQL